MGSPVTVRSADSTVVTAREGSAVAGVNDETDASRKHARTKTRNPAFVRSCALLGTKGPSFDDATLSPRAWPPMVLHIVSARSDLRAQSADSAVKHSSTTPRCGGAWVGWPHNA